MKLSGQLKLELIDIIKNNNLIALQQRVVDDVLALRYSLTNTNRQAIHIAAKEGSFEIVEFLLDTDPLLIEEVDGYHQTPLICAASRGHAKVVQLLVDKHAKLDGTIHAPGESTHGDTALTWAISRGHDDVVEILIKAGALTFINTKDEALELLEHNQKYANLILSDKKIMELLEHTQDNNVSTKEAKLDYQYKIAGRRPSFCAAINWESGHVTVFKETEKLGQGKNGVVGKFVSSDEQVIAVKKFPNKGGWEIADDDGEIERSERIGQEEAHFTQQAYNNEGLYKLFFFKKLNNDGRQLYAKRFATKFIPGKTAELFFKNKCFLCEHTAARLIKLMTEALLFLHNVKGIIHGDIKEDNIQIYEDSTGHKVEFMDFGHSYAITQENAAITNKKCTYWAPERTMRNTPLKPDTNQDVYSFGDMLRFIINLFPQRRALTTFYPSINIFIQGALNTTPNDRPTLQIFYEALSTECARAFNDRQIGVFTQCRGVA